MKLSINRRGFLLAAGGTLVATTAAALPALKGYAPVDPALFAGINRVKDPKAKTLMEKKHAPLIEVPKVVRSGEVVAVTVTVGEVPHPMGAAHYIEAIDLLAGNEPLGRFELRTVGGVAKGTFHVRLERPVTLVARQYCNLHGLWESRLEVAPA